MENGLKSMRNHQIVAFFHGFENPNSRLTLFLGQRYVSKIRPRNFRMAWLSPNLQHQPNYLVIRDLVPSILILKTYCSFTPLFYVFLSENGDPKKIPMDIAIIKLKSFWKWPFSLGCSKKKWTNPAVEHPRLHLGAETRPEVPRSLWIGVDLASDHSRSIDSMWFHGIRWIQFVESLCFTKFTCLMSSFGGALHSIFCTHWTAWLAKGPRGS